MLSVARVTRNIGAGTFLNFVRFVSGKFIAGRRCCRVRCRESRKVRRERKAGVWKKETAIRLVFFPRDEKKERTNAEITSGYMIYILLSLSFSLDTLLCLVIKYGYGYDGDPAGSR